MRRSGGIIVFEITRFAKSNGPLTKRISLADDGSLRSDGSACVMSEGMALRVQLSGVAGLAELIGSLNASEAIALGALRLDLPDAVEIVTKNRLDGMNGAARPDLIARTGAYIGYREKRPAFALLDYDTKGMPVEVEKRIASSGGFWPALVAVVPELAAVARVLRRSTSTGLYRSDTGEKLPGSSGLHVYLAVQDGADIDRFLKALHARCWLAGLGWLMVGAGGQLLERSIVDRMVGAPERLVFEGAPVLDPPLAQDMESRPPISKNGGALDTITACPPLSIVEQAKLRELRAKEADRLAPGSAKARTAFIKQQAERLIERTGMAADAAAKVIARQCEGILLPDGVLPFDDQDLGDTTVADVLADPERYEGATLADPLEGVDYGRCKAKVMLRQDGTPWIHSFAHGRTVYELRYDAAAIRAQLQKTPKEAVANLFVKLALAGDLDADQTEDLRDWVADRAGVGKRAITNKLKAAEQERARQRAEEEYNRLAAERQDPRPRIEVPAINAPWLPHMQAINEVMGSSNEPEPPMRDVEGYVTPVRCRRIPCMHTLTVRGSNEEETEETRLPAPEQPLLTRLAEPELAEMIERYIDYYDPKSLLAVHLPTNFVKHFLNRSDGALPTVTAIATMPIVMPDGTVLSGRGLDRQRGVVFRVSSELQALLPAPEDCTPTAVAHAMRFLTDEWLCDVSADYSGKCVLIAMVLTILERLLLPERPAFFITAGQRGGGKTTTANMISIAALGLRAAAAAWSTSDEERRKALLAYLATGISLIIWDNIPRGSAISCPSIEKALTAEMYSDRILSESNTRTVPASAIIGFTGNNIAPRGDLASRSLIAHLAVDRPDPENRPFRHPDPIGWTEAHRGKILAALYTVLLGNPRLRAAKREAAETRFKMWWHLVGSAVENASRQHAGHVAALTLDAHPSCPPLPVCFKSMFLAGEVADEQACSLTTVLAVIRARWPSGASPSEVAAYTGSADEGAIEFKTALELASGKAIKVVTPIVLTWRLKAVTDAPVRMSDGDYALRYLPDHNNPLFVVRAVKNDQG